MPFTLYEKFLNQHRVATIDDEHVLLYVDFHIMNEYTSPQAFAVEFTGTTISALSVEARMTICNMAVEAGARAAIIAPTRKCMTTFRASLLRLRATL